MKRVRLLFLSARMPYPLDSGGKLRTYHLLRSLGKQYDVTLVTFGSTTSQTIPKGLLDVCEEVVVVHNPLIERHSAWRMIESLASLMPYTMARYSSREMQRTIVRLHADRPFDLIHCDQIHMGQYLGLLPDVPAVVDEHNIESKLWQQQAATASRLKRPLFAAQAALMRICEQAICGGAQGVITCSVQDRDWIHEEAGQRHAEVVPNGVDCERVRPSGEVLREPLSLVFVGSMDWTPNREGILRFHREIWPRLRQRLPHLKCHVVGRNPDAKVRALGRLDDGFVITGSVADVRPYVERAAVYVVPLDGGSGTRLKILEAFAMGKCVVSTVIGAEGIGYTDGEDILIARNDDHFVEQVLAAIGSPGRAAAIGARARRLVEQRYDWRRIGDQLCHFIGETLARPYTEEVDRAIARCNRRSRKHHPGESTRERRRWPHASTGSLHLGSAYGVLVDAEVVQSTFSQIG